MLGDESTRHPSASDVLVAGGLREELAAHPYQAPFWARNRHLQTVWGRLFRPRPRIGLDFETVETTDGDRLHVYSSPGNSDRPHSLLLHGLEGSPRSKYIRGQARALVEMGWGVHALAFRSCDDSPSRAPRLYHLGETGDLDLLVQRLVGRWPGRPLFLSGVSLGANVLVKWLGERGSSLPDEIQAAAAISPPFDALLSGPNIDRALGGFYTRLFLRTLLPKALEKAGQYPEILDRAAIRASRSFVDFDTHATAALHGFDDAEDYWRRCGCGQFLPEVRCPLLLVASRDDPFNPAAGLPDAKTLDSPWLFPQFTDRGGHVGFVFGSPWRARYWAEEQVVRFFSRLAR